MREVRADDSWIYLDVIHDDIAVETGPHPSVTPVIQLRVNGCPAPAPRFSGVVWKNLPSASTLVLAQAALPEGELDLTLHAFGSEHTLPLLKQGRRLSYLQTSDRAGFHEKPANPATEMEAIAWLDEPNCNQQAQP